jgi:two-component system OmpR family response regulator
LTLDVAQSHGVKTPPHTALIVDDEENVAYVVATALRLDGWETYVVATGREALEVAAERQPDLVVLDVMLPDIDGFTVFRRLRDNGIASPVIFLTARESTEDRVRGLTIGGDDYLTKPFSVEELVARCRLILRRAGADYEQYLRYSDLEMDEEGHQVRRGDTLIRLSPTEYKLLRYLLLNSGRVLSRRQILDHVWEYDFKGDGSNVEAFISLLRRKVDALGPPLIQTVRGVGYVLRVEDS